MSIPVKSAKAFSLLQTTKIKIQLSKRSTQELLVFKKLVIDELKKRS